MQDKLLLTIVRRVGGGCLSTWRERESRAGVSINTVETEYYTVFININNTRTQEV